MLILWLENECIEGERRWNTHVHLPKCVLCTKQLNKSSEVFNYLGRSIKEPLSSFLMLAWRAYFRRWLEDRDKKVDNEG